MKPMPKPFFLSNDGIMFPHLDIRCGCGESLIEFRSDRGIEVTAESRQMIRVNGWWSLHESCTNPFCEWSKVRT